jgi:predicted transcriptional regulator
MYTDMAANDRKPKSKTTVITSRIPDAIVERLDKIAESILPIPSRSSLVALAVEEFVSRRKPAKKSRQ